MSMISINCFAADIAVMNEDGIFIYYNYTNNGTELSVTYGPGVKINSAGYENLVTIPESVTFAGRTRTVTCIGDSAFWRCSSLTSITIPKSMKYIGYRAFYQ